MMRIQQTQITALEREQLDAWFTREFPDRCVGTSKDEINAYLDSRAVRASELGYTRPHHLRFLLGYEITCGVAWSSEYGAGSSEILRLLLSRKLDPDRRIDAVERLLYGEADHGR